MAEVILVIIFLTIDAALIYLVITKDLHRKIERILLTDLRVFLWKLSKINKTKQQ